MPILPTIIDEISDLAAAQNGWIPPSSRAMHTVRRNISRKLRTTLESHESTESARSS
jgi:hypothetical protein